MVNLPPQARSHEDDSVALYSTSTTDSLLDSTSPSSTSPNHSPTHPSSSLQSTSYMLTVRNLSYKPVTKPSQLRKMCGLVTQEDNLLPFLTVKETLMFSASFRLRQSINEKGERVALAHIANSYIGDAETRGVSGGEKKRVSIGVDMIRDPPILLLDEPTSGLDSASALQVVELLSSMTNF